MAQSTICLTMIVKNEAHLIEDTLKHLLKYIKFSYWVICDTGSTDDTKEIIQRFFDSQSIPGELIETPWRDFAYNRTDAFQHAYGKADYAFVWDADDEISGNFVLPKDLTADWYKFTFGSGNTFRYSRCQLFKNTKKWKYVGVLHEYPACCEPADDPVDIMGDYYFISGRRGDRSKDPNKYIKDAQVLEKAFNEAVESKDPIHCRYAFYCAQSYNSANLLEKAIEYYKKVLNLDNWSQEKYVSCLEIYDLYERLGTEHLGIPFLIDSFHYDSTRIECYYRLIKFYCINRLPQVSYGFYTCIQNYFENQYLKANIADKLFAKKNEYDFFLPYYMIIVADRLQKHELSSFCYHIIFKQKNIPGIWWLNNLFHNMKFCINHLPKTTEFLENMLDYFHLMLKEGIVLDSPHYTTIENVLNAYRSTLTVTPTSLPTIKNTPVRIMMSFTTCKRLDLFKQTMNSIINTWKDLDMVDMFYCVDDNSSEEDRAEMKALYPFFTFYFKKPEEKGHRQSMNIIWNTLNEIKPTYWIHLEDDWLYFHPRNYISNSIEYLERFKKDNVHQIVFNKNYGLFFSDMDRVGGIELCPDLLLHEKRDGLVGKNCGYWPHYSLQPSIVRTEVILSLGNYDSVNSFFERDYANKYFSNGYKTAFFPAIYSIHIGKQHWEKEGKNAYALNNTNQFNTSVPSTPVVDDHLANLPLTGTMKEHLDEICKKLKTLTPFALIRPSDGEYSILKGKSLTNCDNWTFKSGGILQRQLIKALKTVNSSLYIGIPCNTCNRGWNCTEEIYGDFINTFQVPKDQITYANIFMNSNWSTFVSFMTSFKHGFYYIGSGTHTGYLTIKGRLSVDSKLVDTWDTSYEHETARVLEFIKDKTNQVFCFSAGPLSKVWIPLCFSVNPNNIYMDIGSSLDHIVKNTTTRPYMIEGNAFQTDSCSFLCEPVERKKNLLYMCVLHNKDYIKLLQILLTSMRVYSSLDFDILIITQESFVNGINVVGKKLGIPLFIHTVEDKKSIFEAACARLYIFDYPSIDSYEKIFYIDTDIILKKDIASVFDLAVDDVVYVIPEATIAKDNFGRQFFDFTTISSDTPGINSGTLLFKNSPRMKAIFNTIITHIDTHVKAEQPIPLCMDQPFISYNMINESVYNNSALKPFVSLYEEPNTVVNYETSIICHFTFPIGNFGHKYYRMKNFFIDLLKKQEVPSRNCICGWREGFCPECSGIFTLETKYILGWGENKITLHKGIVYTPWGAGKYVFLHTNCIEATWNSYSHIIYLYNSSFLSIRSAPQDFSIMEGKFK